MSYQLLEILGGGQEGRHNRIGDHGVPAWHFGASAGDRKGSDSIRVEIAAQSLHFPKELWVH